MPTRVPYSGDQIRQVLQASGYYLYNSEFTYSVPTADSVWAAYAAGSEPFSSYAAPSASLAAAFRAAIAIWDSYILPNFTEVPDNATSSGVLRVAFTAEDSGIAGYAYQGTPDDTDPRLGDIWMNSSELTQSFSSGTYLFEALMHEIGHTLGLKHSFEQPAVPAPYENTRFTIMSYTQPSDKLVVFYRTSDNVLHATISGVVTTTPMVADIAAVQAIYGADPTTNAGDTVYRFTENDPTLQTIYDAGGNDTIDLSNFTRDSVIDLTPGGYSSLGIFTKAQQIAYYQTAYSYSGSFIANTINNNNAYEFRDNLGIALSTVIENAIGGAGNDVIYGNDVANRIDGGPGADTMQGGKGDDTYIVDNVGDVVIENAGEGTDTIITSVSYTLPDNVENLTLAGTADLTGTGNALDNTFVANSGHDTLIGGDGNDAFTMGAFLDPLDRIDGGAGGNDQVGIQGDYTGAHRLVLQDATLTNVEVLAALPGYSYDIVLANGNVAAGAVFTVYGGTLGASDNLTVDGSLVTQGSLRFFGGLGVDTLTGGAQNDGFYFGPGAWGASDVVHGGGGANDQLALDGSYSVTLDARADVEVVVLLPGPTGSLNTFHIAVDDSFVAAGAAKTIYAISVATDLVIDGSGEHDGSLTILGGYGNDTLTGGAGNDTLFGGLGKDVLVGGPGADIFLYDDPVQSSGATFDTLADFQFGIDHIRISGETHDVFSSLTTGKLSAGTFDTDLQAAVGALLHDGNAVYFTPDTGDFKGQTFLIVDEGAAGYAAGSDYVFHLPSAPPVPNQDIVIA